MQSKTKVKKVSVINIPDVTSKHCNLKNNKRKHSIANRMFTAVYLLPQSMQKLDTAGLSEKLKLGYTMGFKCITPQLRFITPLFQ